MPAQRRLGFSESNAPGVVVDGGDGPIHLITPAGVTLNGEPLADAIEDELSGAYARQPTVYRAGTYLSHPGPVSTMATVEGTIGFMPLLVPKALTADRIAAEVTTVGTAGAVLRLGIYAADDDGNPAGLLVDAGTIDGTVLGTQQITISQALPAGLVWLASVVQGAAATRPILRSRNGAGYFLLAQGDINAVTFTLPGYSRTAGAVPGALPATAGTVGGNTAAPSLAVRVV